VFTGSGLRVTFIYTVQNGETSLGKICNIIAQIVKIPNIISDPLTPINFYIFKECEKSIEHIAFVLMVTNYSIWQTRRKIIADQSNINYKGILAKILTHVSIRERN